MGSCCAADGEIQKYKVIDQIPNEMLELQRRNPEVRSEMNDSSITFYPSPNLKPDEDGDYNTEILTHELFTSSTRLASLTSEFESLVACHDDDLMIIQQKSKLNPFIQCCVKAWSEHFPLAISPQNIWLIILQSISLHLNRSKSTSNPLLQRTVSRHDKVRLTPLPSMALVDHTSTRDQKRKSSMVLNHSYDFSTSGTMNNREWISKIKEFTAIIAADVLSDDSNDLLTANNFTGTTRNVEMSCKMAPINVLTSKYKWQESVDSGVPSITLNGSKEDWVRLKQKTETILEKKCDRAFARKWSESLIPILDRFIAVFDGDIDCVFWNSMIQRGATSLVMESDFVYTRIQSVCPLLSQCRTSSRGSTSGACQRYTGWINCFFPIINGQDNEWCEPYSFEAEYIHRGSNVSSKSSGNKLLSFPSGLSQVDAFMVHDIDDTSNAGHLAPQQRDVGDTLESPASPTISDEEMVRASSEDEEHIKIVSGFIGYTQNQLNYCIEPTIGWFVICRDDTGFHSDVELDDGRMPGIEEDFDGMLDYHGGAFDEGDENEEDSMRNSDELLLVNDHTVSHSSGSEKGNMRKNRNGQEFMSVDVEDEDDVEQEMHRLNH